MAKMEKWEDGWEALQELREWAFQECRKVEITEEMSAVEVIHRAGKLEGFSRVVFRIDEMAERADAERSEAQGT